MAHDEQPTVKTPDEARAGQKMGVVWKVLAVSIALAIIAMIVIGLGTETPTAN